MRGTKNHLETIPSHHVGDVSPARFAGWYRDLVEEPRARFMAHQAGGGERTFKIVAGALTTAAAAGTMGLVNARFAVPGDDAARVFGAPVDLTVAGICYGLGLLGYFGSETHHVVNIGHGCLAAYGYRKITSFTRERFAAPSVQEQQAVRGALPAPPPPQQRAWPYNHAAQGQFAPTH